MPESFFAQRSAVLATMHRKEAVIAPLLAPLGIEIILPTGLNTDQFGTFTRDRDRSGSQLEAARLKAKAALELTGTTLAIASEGSFIPHPSFPVVPCNRELVLLLDLDHNLEIVGEALSLSTNFNHQTIRSLDEAYTFAQKIGFPSHGLVVMTHAATQQADELVKGITTEEQLNKAVATALERSLNGTIHIETDMRAMHNPTRMDVIKMATLDMIAAIHRTCPTCGYPGMIIRDRIPGLPCGLCYQPTALFQALVYQCQHCHTSQHHPFPDGIRTADPAQCPYCNP